MAAVYQYTPLRDFLSRVFDDVIRANIHAKGLQAEYLQTMAEHHSPLPVVDFVQPLEVVTFKIDFHFRREELLFTMFERLMSWLRRRPRPPEGIYLAPCNAGDAFLSFSVTLGAAGAGPDITPQADDNTAYYVVTKVG